MNRVMGDRIEIREGRNRSVRLGGVPNPHSFLPERDGFQIERTLYTVDFISLERGKDVLHVNGKDLDAVRFMNERLILVGLEDAISVLEDRFDIVPKYLMEMPYEDYARNFSGVLQTKEEYEKTMEMARKRLDLFEQARSILFDGLVPPLHTLSIDVSHLGFSLGRLDTIDKIDISNIGTYWGKNEKHILSVIGYCLSNFVGK